MQPEIKYIELKSGFSDDGPAWIGKVEFSKTGNTIYFNGHAFKHYGKGHYSDIETGENYWISGVKKNGEDRHQFGKGKIQIDKSIIHEYLSIVDFDKLLESKFDVVEILRTEKTKFVTIENQKFEDGFDYYSLREKELHKLTSDELNFLIEYTVDAEKNAKFNKGRRSVKKYRIELEDELSKRVKLKRDD